MTPETKAKEIFDRFHFFVCNDLGLSQSDSSETAARNCSLVCCDEILSALAKNGVVYPHREYENEKEYWTSVKNELSKL